MFRNVVMDAERKVSGLTSGASAKDLFIISKKNSQVLDKLFFFLSFMVV